MKSQNHMQSSQRRRICFGSDFYYMAKHICLLTRGPLLSEWEQEIILIQKFVLDNIICSIT